MPKIKKPKKLKNIPEDFIDSGIIDIEDAAKLLHLTNDYIDNFTTILTPQKYEKQPKTFVNLATTGPAMITASILTRLSRMYGVDRQIIVELFDDKLDHCLTMVEEIRKHEGQDE